MAFSPTWAPTSGALPLAPHGVPSQQGTSEPRKTRVLLQGSPSRCQLALQPHPQPATLHTPVLLPQGLCSSCFFFLECSQQTCPTQRPISPGFPSGPFSQRSPIYTLRETVPSLPPYPAPLRTTRMFSSLPVPHIRSKRTGCVSQWLLQHRERAGHRAGTAQPTAAEGPNLTLPQVSAETSPQRPPTPPAVSPVLSPASSLPHPSAHQNLQLRLHFSSVTSALPSGSGVGKLQPEGPIPTAARFGKGFAARPSCPPGGVAVAVFVLRGQSRGCDGNLTAHTPKRPGGREGGKEGRKEGGRRGGGGG